MKGAFLSIEEARNRVAAHSLQRERIAALVAMGETPRMRAAFGQAGRQTGAFTNVLAIQLVLTPAIVATIVAAEQTFTCPGVPATTTAPAIVVVNRQGAPNGAIEVCHCRVSAVNQIGISWVNPTAAGVTPTAATTYNVVVMW